MKVAINQRVVDGPWGGGNRFVAALIERLAASGHVVAHDLESADIDIILVIDPRWRSPNISFGPRAIFNYLQFRNSKAIVVHRINECDERKNTRGMNFRLRAANYCADHTVFVGSWLKDLNVWQRGERHSVILNGADATVFKPGDNAVWNGSAPLKLVTHHWGGNWMKGFDIYSELDRMLDEPEWAAKVSFTYIGNLPRGFSFKHANYVQPLNGTALAAELRRHHGYISASINEPGGHHQNEGALCGLPLLYRRSGCMPEYCAGFGVDFDENDFPTRLDEYIRQYPALKSAMNVFPHTADAMVEHYLELFESLYAKRAEIAGQRRLWRSPLWALINQFPLL